MVLKWIGLATNLKLWYIKSGPEIPYCKWSFIKHGLLEQINILFGVRQIKKYTFIYYVMTHDNDCIIDELDKITIIEHLYLYNIENCRYTETK